jgi:Flp pilus assembly pilin Flp
MQIRNTLGGQLARLRSDQAGLTTVEYVIVLCLIAAISVATWNEFGDLLLTRLESASTLIEENTAP